MGPSNDIVLVQPPLTRQERYGVLSAGGSCLPPFGLAWLAAVARRDGFRPAIIDAEAEGLGVDATVERILASGAPIVGLTATTISAGRAGTVAAALRDRGFDGILLLGGAHVTAVPEPTLAAYEAFDGAVLGEGEATLAELLPLLLGDSVGKGRDALPSVPGLAVRRPDGTVVRTGERSFLGTDELAALPLPAFDLLPRLDVAYQPSALRTNRLPSSSLVTTRGCGGQCTFCDNTVFGRRIRSFSAEYVIEMVDMLVTDYGVRDLTVYDDNFVVNRKRLAEFCRLLRARGHDVSWSCNARVDVIDDDLVAQIKDAGCWQISVGIESGVQEILDRECKGVTLQQVRRALSILHGRGIRTKGFFMIGHPGETVATADQTLAFALELPLDDFQMSFLTPFPGTCLYHAAAQWGTLDERWDEMNMWTPVFVPHGMTRDQLVTLQRRAMRRFYFRPRVMARYLWTCLTKPAVVGAVLRGGLALLRGVFSSERAGRSRG